MVLHRVATNYCLGASERRAIVGVERCLATIFDERHFFFEHMEELAFIPIPWRWLDQLRGKVHEGASKSVSSPASPRRCRVSSAQGCIEWRRIARTFALRTTAVSILGMAVAL